MTPVAFIATFTTAIVNASQNTGIFPSVKMAQMALESGWGAHIIGNNAFGIKAAGAYSPYWQGAAINADTLEYVNGNYQSGPAMFRAYRSVQDSISDHTYFLQQNARYTNAGVFSATTPEAQAHALKAAGYATDPQYAYKLINIINNYNLKTLDTIAAKALPAIVPLALLGLLVYGAAKLIRQ